MINVTGLGREDVEKMRTFLSKHQGIERDKDVVRQGVATLIERLKGNVDLDDSFSAIKETLIQAVADYEKRRTADQAALELSFGGKE
jgi:hypothetical protein